MNKTTIISSALVILGLGIIGVLWVITGTKKINTPPVTEATTSDVKNMNYVIDGQVFSLTNGTVNKEVAPGSASKQTVSIFGEPVYGDLNADGISDAAVMLVSSGVGSGSFYYAVLAIATGSSTYKATNALLLGDRIAPQTVEIHEGRALYNYAERKANEPMTTQPSVGKSLWINYDIKTGEIGELVKNFEGEADTSKMTLGMKKWEWVKTQMNDGKITIPKKTGVFTLAFAKDGKVSIGTDCNSMGGIYTVKGTKLTFSQIISTIMYCEGSQEQEYSKTLGEVASYLFTSKGELVLEIKMDSGTMIFR